VDIIMVMEYGFLRMLTMVIRVIMEATIRVITIEAIIEVGIEATITVGIDKCMVDYAEKTCPVMILSGARH